MFAYNYYSSVRCHNYAEDIEYVTPSLLAQVEIEFQHINQWSLDLLRTTSVEMEKTFNQISEYKLPGLHCKCKCVQYIGYYQVNWREIKFDECGRN